MEDLRLGGSGEDGLTAGEGREKGGEKGVGGGETTCKLLTWGNKSEQRQFPLHGLSIELGY